MVAMLFLAVLSGCSESESLVDGMSTDDPNVIHVGGIDNATVATSLGGFTTRAAGDNTSVDAETVEWLLGPLFGGLDITYGAQGNPDTKKVAILKLLKKVEGDDISASNIKYSEYSTETEKIAEYSFKYLGTNTDAKWYDNGEHFFQGVFVPEKLRYVPAHSETAETVNGVSSAKAPNLKIDQSKDVTTNVDANYTLLERYLGMPADAHIHATVGRIKLPFRHRLSRVLAYVLIDPTMGSGVTIKGYKKAADGTTDVATEDATTSSIRFNNVKILAGVKEVDELNGHATLTPQWDQSRKVIPHFVEESGSKNSLGELKDENFIMYYNTELKTYIFPTNDEDWVSAYTAWNDAYTTALGAGTSDEDKRKAADKADASSGYKRTLYGKVPVYDIIVRPTYKSEEMVMYDEENYETEKQSLASQKNNIDFEITLNNGLEYTKQFEFDLDANFQTVVFLRINRESIDYNSSGAEVWKEETDNDGYYGVNNQNGNTLSFAGSSWQRAYRIGSRNPNITDGHYYGQDDTTDDNDVQDDDKMPWYPQYVDQSKWVEMFAEAHAGGLHHGDYFILDQNITIDARLLPDDFVFTGHLDGQDYTITLTNGGEDWTEYVETNDYSIVPLYSNQVGTVYNLPTLYTKVHHDDVYYQESELTVVDEISYVTSTLTPVYYTQDEIDAAHEGDDAYGKTIYNQKGWNTSGATEATTSTIKTAAYDEYNEVHPSMNQAMTALAETYYEKTGATSYDDFYYRKPFVLYKAVAHTSGTTLFAGLNGAYAAAIGEANVHSEGGRLVPYVDADGTGWRAEVINTKISGADMFPAEAIVDGKYDVNKVSGYIYNCWKGSDKIMPHTPTLPKYK